MKIMEIADATVYDVDFYARRCKRGECERGAVFLVDYPAAKKPEDRLAACTDHLQDAIDTCNEEV